MPISSITDLKATAKALPPTKSCAYFASHIAWEHLDKDARSHATRHFLDTLGSAIAGATQHATDTVATTLAFAGEANSNQPTLVPGRHTNTTGLLAATHLMGTAAHGLELDDGYRPGMMHPGCVVIPVALLLGGQLGKSGPEMLTAIVAGYEIGCRLAAATHPQARWRGFHPTPAVGVFAAAATAGRLLGLTPVEMESALGIAASSSAGLFTFLDGGDVKRLHGGFGAREGLFAALLASKGLVGPPNALESDNGYLHSHAGGDLPEHDYSALTLLDAGGFSDSLSITQCYLKPYASCRHIHAPVEMLLALRAKHQLRANDIEEIRVSTYAVAAAHGTPGWSEMTTAQMSMPYALSAALVRGKLTPAEFSDSERNNTEITDFCKRVHTFIDSECEAKYPGLRPAKIEIILKNGTVLTAHVDEPPGEPGRRLTDEAVEEKFTHLSMPVIGVANTRQIISNVRSLFDCKNVNELIRLSIPSLPPKST